MLPLLKTQHDPRTLNEKILYRAGKIATQLLGAVQPEQQQRLPRQYNFDAHLFSKYFKSTHYGIMIPDLPEPHRYLSCAAVIGDIGAPITHVPMSQTQNLPHETATLVHGTALSTPQNSYAIFNIEQDLKIQQQPFSIEFADHTKLWEDQGIYFLKTQRADLEVDLRLEPTPAITWFSHSKLYQHFSVLMQYQGYVSHHNKKVMVQGLCTLEHWKSIAQSSLMPKHLLAKYPLIPLTSFTYQVINLDHEQQLVLAFICFAGQPAYTAISYRNIQGTSVQYDSAVFELTTLQPEPLITPDGYAMYVPQQFTWIAYHAGEKVLQINAEVDTPYCYGLAAGYVGAYQWQGVFEHKQMHGRGYIEFIDRR